MSERVRIRKLRIDSEEQPEYGIRFNRVKASRRRVAYSFNDDPMYKCLESYDWAKYDQRFGFPSYDRLIEEDDGRNQPNDDSWYPRKRYATERERYNRPFRGSAHSKSSQDTGYQLCWNCNSGSCRRGSECSQLCQDVYIDSYEQLNDACLNNLQSENDRLESRRRCGHEKDWKRAIDKGHDDCQWHSSDLDSSSDMDLNTPPRKCTTSTGICKWFLRGHCRRGASCWYVHDVSGDYFQRGHSHHRPAGQQDGLLSDDDTHLIDRCLLDPLALKHNSHTTHIGNNLVSTVVTDDKTEVTGPNFGIKRTFDGEPVTEARKQTDASFESRHLKSSWEHIPGVSNEVIQRTIKCDASEQAESDGWRSWGDKSRNTQLASTMPEKVSTYDGRHTSGSDNARNLNIDGKWDFDGYASDHKFLKRSERSNVKSNGYFTRRRKKTGCWKSTAIDGHEFLDGNSDVDFNSCRRGREPNGYKNRSFSGKHSKIGNFDGKTPTINVNNASRFKPKRLKKKSASDLDHKHQLWKDDSATLCKHFMRGYCKRGNRCWFPHETVTHRAPADIDEKKCLTNQTSLATNVIPIVESPVHDAGWELRSTKNTKRSHRRKDQNSGGNFGRMCAKSSGEHSETIKRRIKAFSGTKFAFETDIQDRPSNKGKKIGCNQEGRHEGDHKKCTEICTGKIIVPETDMHKDLEESGKKNFDYEEGEGDDNQNKNESANCRTHGDVKMTTAQKIVLGKILAVDPCALDLKSLDSEKPSVKEEVTEEASNDHHSPDLVCVPSASLEQCVYRTSESKATSATCNVVKESCPPLKDADQFLVKSLKTGADLDPRSISSDAEVDKPQKALFSNGFGECLCSERLSTEKLVEKPLERLLERQESCASMREPEENHNVDQWISSHQDNKLVIYQKGTSNTTGCIETALGEKNLLEADMHDEFVDDKICDNQEPELVGRQKNNSALGNCGVNNSDATTVSTDHCGEEMLPCETCPVISNANTAASFEKQATEETSFDDIGLDLSLEHYIYSSLSLDHYISHMEDENEAIPTSYDYKENRLFLEDAKSVMTSENPIQHSDRSLAQQTCDDISQTMPILTSSSYDNGPNSGKMTSTEIEEIPNGPDIGWHESCTLNEQEKRPLVKLELTDVGNTLAAENSLHVNEKLNFSRNERNVIFAAESLDKYFGSSSMGRNSETKHTSVWNTSGRGPDFETNVSEESVGIPSGPHSEQYDILASEKEQEDTAALRLKGPVAALEANEKCSSALDSCNAGGILSSYDSNDTDSKCEESIEDDDEKLLLRSAVLVLVKEILDPLWTTGRISSKDIYKTIAKKSVDKVCGSVKGVSIPRTKENIDCYLLHNKAKIAQLVLAYVYMYPVKL